MGEIADQIIEEFKKKGLPLPRGVDTSSRPGRQVYGAINGVVQDGGGVKVSMPFMDEDSKPMPVKDAARISFRDAQASTADQTIRDQAYNDYIAGLNKAGRRGIVLDSLPGYIDGYDVPKVFMALADAGETESETRARAGIEQLLSVARTCRARAQAGQLSAEESKSATFAADYIEGLAHAAELILTGKVASAAEPAMRAS